MAAPRGSPASKLDNTSTNNAVASNADAELLRSLHQLSISTSDSRSPSRASSSSPRPLAHTLSSFDRLALGSPSLRNTRSPVGRSVSNGIGSNQSRSSTPTLLRKSSMTSLHSMNGVTPSRAPSKRSSSTQAFSPMVSRSPLNGGAHMVEEERLKQTDASVANAYFKSELELLHNPDSNKSSATMVILHDACYGHRYSRPKSTKSDLATVVERPERLQAVSLGVALAYVRLGDRHHDGKFQIHPKLDPTTLPSIPFRIQKTDRRISLASPAVTNVHGTKWMEELKILCDLAGTRLATGDDELERPKIDRKPSADPPERFHVGDLYLCDESLGALEGALGAVCEAVDIVLSPSPIKRVFVGVRPPGHHCTADLPHGFCWLNNVHVGIMHGFMNHGLTHAAIIDIDLHHGDGSQSIAWDHNSRRVEPPQKPPRHKPSWMKTSIGYFSLHDINSYPCEYGDPETVKNASVCIDNAHGQSIWNVHLQEWKSEVEFWSLYQTKYSILLEKTRNYLRLETDRLRSSGQVPKAAIFLSAGFDASEWESDGMQRHRVNVPTEFYARLTRDVVKLAAEEGLSVEGRIISVLEGGYSDRALSSGVLSHLSGLAGNEVPAKDEPGNGFSRELGRRISSGISSLSRRSTLSESDGKIKVPGFPYDPVWWSRQELEKLDAAMASVPPDPRPARDITPPTYSSPTQSSNAKVVAPARIRRSTSGLSSLSGGPQPVIYRAPTPPPPDVHWPTAARELSKLLIPTHRSTASVTWEELKADAARMKADATRLKRERQSFALQEVTIESSDNGAPAIRKSLRERKPVKPPPSGDLEDPNKSRRKTMAGTGMLTSEKAAARGVTPSTAANHARQPSRRLSAASTMTLANDHMEPPLPVDSTITRRGSSESIRPDSSMSVRTQATTKGLNVKKTRPAAPPRKDSTKTTAPKSRKTTKATALKVESKASTTTQGQTSSSKSTSPTRKQGINGETVGPGPISRETSMAPSTGNSESGTEVAKVTNGIHKIKINVITKEMKEAREKAEREKMAMTPNVDEVKPVVSTTPTAEGINSLATSTSSYTAMGSPEQVGGQHLTPNSPHRSFAPAPASVAESHVSTIQPPELLAPKKEKDPVSPLVDSTPKATHASSFFVPYQPEGATPKAIRQTAPVHWMPTNVVDTPMEFKRGHQFTATSAIPFSPGPAHGNQEIVPVKSEKEPEQEDADMWEVPETPERRG